MSRRRGQGRKLIRELTRECDAARQLAHNACNEVTRVRHGANNQLRAMQELFGRGIHSARVLCCNQALMTYPIKTVRDAYMEAAWAAQRALEKKLELPPRALDGCLEFRDWYDPITQSTTVSARLTVFAFQPKRPNKEWRNLHDYERHLRSQSY